MNPAWRSGQPTNQVTCVEFRSWGRGQQGQNLATDRAALQIIYGPHVCNHNTDVL